MSISFQMRKFFGIAHELGYDSVKVKEAAKAQLHLTHLSDATEEQMNWLIAKLETEAAKRRYV